MKKKLIYSIALLLLTQLFLTGCWDQKIFEEIGFTLQLGIESSENGDLLVTRTSPVVNKEIQRKLEFLSSEGGSIRDTRTKERRISPKSVEGGKIQQVMFSKDFAMNGGIHDILEVFERDPTDAMNAFVAVVEGSPRSLLEASLSFQDKPRSAFYISELLRSNVKRSYSPETTIYNFNVNYFSVGIDPVAPIIKLESLGVRIVGTALFCNDKMVGKISADETPMLIALMNKFNRTDFILGSSASSAENSTYKTKVAVTLTDVNRRIKIDFENNKAVIKISLDFKGNIDEYHWETAARENMEELLEAELGTQLKTHCEKIITTTQEVGSDPIGIGNIIRAKYPSYWKSVDWSEAYKSAEITVDTKLDIINRGVIH